MSEEGAIRRETITVNGIPIEIGWYVHANIRVSYWHNNQPVAAGRQFQDPDEAIVFATSEADRLAAQPPFVVAVIADEFEVPAAWHRNLGWYSSEHGATPRLTKQRLVWRSDIGLHVAPGISRSVTFIHRFPILQRRIWPQDMRRLYDVNLLPMKDQVLFRGFECISLMTNNLSFTTAEAIPEIKGAVWLDARGEANFIAPENCSSELLREALTQMRTIIIPKNRAKLLTDKAAGKESITWIATAESLLPAAP